MFRSFRWRLTFWFVTLTTLVYMLSAFGAIWLFHIGLNAVLEEELEALVSEIVPAINLNGHTPNLQEWAKTSHSVPFKFLPTIQLYDQYGHLIEQHGPRGVPQLYAKEQEVRTADYAFLVFSTPLWENEKLIGYLQLQLSLKNIDRATRQFGMTMAIVAPFLLIGLGIAGYVFSGIAARPVEGSFHSLRRFMSDAGHELKTPLSIIQANAESIESEISSQESASNRLAVIMRSTERLGNLVRDLSLLSKMESPTVITKRTPIDLGQLVRGILEEFEELFKNKNISLTIDQIQSISLMGDADSLKRLLTNLLENALRYTEAGGRVFVSLDTAGRNARLVIKDTGIGIPTESLPKIFDRFYRVESSRSRAAGGSGLGLSIVRAIVDAHKGKIDVSSQVGVGTTFVVLLPIRH